MNGDRRAQEAAAFLDPVRTAIDGAELIILGCAVNTQPEEALRRAHAMLLVAARNLNFCELQVAELLHQAIHQKCKSATPAVEG